MNDADKTTRSRRRRLRAGPLPGHRRLLRFPETVSSRRSFPLSVRDVEPPESGSKSPQGSSILSAVSYARVNRQSVVQVHGWSPHLQHASFSRLTETRATD